MNFETLVELAWKSALCAGVTLLLLLLLRDRSAAERSRVAHAGLLAILLLPVAAVVLPNMEIEAPRSMAALARSRVVTVAETGSRSSSPIAGAADSQIGTEQAAALVPAVGSGELLLLIPAGLLLLITLVAILRLRLLVSRSRVLVDPSWLTALAAMQDRFGFKQGTALLVSRELRSPLSWGVLRPVILLDERAAGDSRQASAIIAHELAHVARLDWAKLLLGRAATALFWFNPLVWILASRCHELREEAADDVVLSTDFASADYAELLVGVARHENRGLLLAANGVAPSGSSLSRRVALVLDSSRRRVSPQLGWTLACCGGALLLNAPLAALTPISSTHVMAPVRLAASGAPERPPFRPAANLKADSAEAPAAAAALGVRNGTSERRSTVLVEALIEAAKAGDRETVDGLLDAGLSPDSRVYGDGTPLIAAAHAGHLDLVKRLLGRGADINLGIDGDGNPLIAAAAAGRLDVVRHLLDAGADIEAIVPSDENALMQASYGGHEAVVRLLLARGADVNSRYGSRTPLGMARLGGRKGIESILNGAGARR